MTPEPTGITIQTARVFYAPTRRRRFFSKAAAIRAEAIALIEAKYPTEEAERDENGREYHRGWYWRELPRSEVLLRRMMRLVSKSIKHP